jgi:molybdopterin converting factor small subunit
MEIEVRLFATFKNFLPEGAKGFSYMKTIQEGTNIGVFLQELKLPEEIPKIIIIKGSPVPLDFVLHDGDIASIFPPIAGG